MKILFVNHWAARTGAPIVLLHFLKWLKQHHQTIRFDVLSLKTGDLLDDFTEISNQHYFYNHSDNLFTKALQGLKGKVKTNNQSNLTYPKHKLDTIAKNDYDIIYANTVVSISVSRYIKNKSISNPKLLVHLHELNLTINMLCPELESYKNDIDLTIAVSEKVKQNLVSNWSFSDSNIKVVYAYSQIPEYTENKITKSFIVGASGIVGWRKGTDFFLLVADYVFKQIPEADISFQWVGKISGVNRMIYEEDVRKLNLNNKVEFTGKRENPHEFFANFDVFLMTSKEDPFPLVCVEVGMMGKPILCFEGATGTEEVLKGVEGAVVPYLDIVKMGDAVINYYKNDNLKKEDGNKVKQIFQGFNPENQGGKIFEIMKALID